MLSTEGQSLPRQNENHVMPSRSQIVHAHAEKIFNELRELGFKDKDIITVSSELLSQLSAELSARSAR